MLLLKAESSATGGTGTVIVIVIIILSKVKLWFGCSLNSEVADNIGYYIKLMADPLALLGRKTSSNNNH